MTGGFIEAAEATMLTALVRERFRGDGVIVDGGCFVGATTAALCAGLDPPRGDAVRDVIAIDRFQALDHYLVEFFARRGDDVRYGESFLHCFLAGLAPHLARIEVRAGDLVRVGRVDRPIEIAVVDVAKSQGLNAYVLTQWFPRLLPGASTVVQQDFHAPSHAWIAAAMGELGDCFSVRIAKSGESCVFDLDRPIPPSRLQQAARLDPRSPEGLRALDAMAERLPDAARASLRIMRALALHRLGRADEARRTLDALLALSPAPPDAKWNQWLGMALAIVQPAAFAALRRTAEVYVDDAHARLGG